MARLNIVNFQNKLLGLYYDLLLFICDGHWR